MITDKENQGCGRKTVRCNQATSTLTVNQILYLVTYYYYNQWQFERNAGNLLTFSHIVLQPLLSLTKTTFLTWIYFINGYTSNY